MDSIADFPLHAAPSEQLGFALGKCMMDFLQWQGQAGTIATFSKDARTVGVERPMFARSRKMMNFVTEKGYIVARSTGLPIHEPIDDEVVSKIVDNNLSIAEYGVKTAAIVILHTGCEQFLWRLVRFGLVKNRQQAILWIGDRELKIRSLMNRDLDDVLDGYIEKWWEALSRAPLLKRWDCLTGLLKLPSKLIDPPDWKFTREMLAEFDETRHSAVHHSAKAVRDFDFDGFSSQLQRALSVWWLYVAEALETKIPAGSLLNLEAKWM